MIDVFWLYGLLAIWPSCSVRSLCFRSKGRRYLGLRSPGMSLEEKSIEEESWLSYIYREENSKDEF